MISKIFSVVLLAMFCGTVNAQNVVDVYILAGQSNADGRGDSGELSTVAPEFVDPQSDTLIWYNNPGNDVQTDGFAALAAGFSDPPRAFDFVAFGPELSFASAVRDATETTNDIAIVKVADGGTSITSEWDPNSNPTGSHYNALFEQVDLALAALQVQGDIGVIRGVIWHQGESNRNRTAYTDDLSDLIAGIRDAYGDDLPFVFGELSRDRDDNAGFNSRAAVFVNDPNNVNVALVSSIGLSTSDTTHFDAASQIELGERFATAIAPLVTLEIEVLLGDMNGNGEVNNRDIMWFALAIFDRSAYDLMFPQIDPDEVGDFDGDGTINNRDIASFAAALGF